MTRKFCHLMVIRIGMNKMAGGDKHNIDYTDKKLQLMAKLWSILVRGVS